MTLSTADKTITDNRGVARRRPRGPGLNLKMQKNLNKSEIPDDPCLHEIQYCHIKH